ncbi:MAG TPA: hypothetical protein VGC77_15140 [Rhodopseudomonas sp.]|uniref:hypothetical protein n=1 Tax=Rhodopseudomonas sp. TaxID=1078 RepID=UPI002ED89915
MILLLVTGLGLLLAGLAAIAFGVPVKEFSFGNTLIVCGTIVACTGAMLLAMRAAARALLASAQGIGASAPQSNTADRRLPPPEPAAQEHTPGDGENFLFSRDRPATDRPHPGGAGSANVSSPAANASAPAPAAAPPPWQEEIARDRARPRSQPASRAPEREPEPDTESAEPGDSAPKRRNLLFASTRRERERAARGEAAAPEQSAATSPELPLSASEPARRPTFEEAWPEPERARGEPLRRTRLFPGVEALNAAEANEPEPAAAAQPEEAAPQVTVLKSGVVDGMKYSLYSDGSIEAEMPEGLMRFASIDELRSHLDQRS